MVAGKSIRMSWFFAISSHTQYVPVILLCVAFCESTSFLLPLNLYTFYSFHLKTPSPSPPSSSCSSIPFCTPMVLSRCYHPDFPHWTQIRAMTVETMNIPDNLDNCCEVCRYNSLLLSKFNNMLKWLRMGPLVSQNSHSIPGSASHPPGQMTPILLDEILLAAKWDNNGTNCLGLFCILIISTCRMWSPLAGI